MYSDVTKIELRCSDANPTGILLMSGSDIICVLLMSGSDIICGVMSGSDIICGGQHSRFSHVRIV